MFVIEEYYYYGLLDELVGETMVLVVDVVSSE